MRFGRVLAWAAVVAIGLSAPAAAYEPEDTPWDEIDRVLREQPAAAPTEDDAESATDRDLSGAAAPANDTAAARPNGAGVNNDRLDPEPRPERSAPATVAAPAPSATPTVAPPAQAQAPSPALTPAPAPAQAQAAQPKFEPTQAPPAATPAQAAPAAAQAQPTPAQPAATAPSTPPAATATAAAPAPAPVAGNGPPLYLPVKNYFETKAAVTLANFIDPDREAVLQFYTARMGQAMWVTKDGGFNGDANSLIAALKDADNWGLASEDYKVPGLARIGNGAFSEDDLTDTEVKLSLVAMEYARHARGDRINDPTTQLSSYLDRKPNLVDRKLLLETLATAPDKGAYLLSLHPKHEQFERLRQKLVALRANAGKDELEPVPDGPKLTPGKSHWHIALIRKHLKVPPPAMKPDGTAADETFYDAQLAAAVERFKEKNGIEPLNSTITSALRKALNATGIISETQIIANMEQWRWMPEDLGATHIAVNIPEFTVRVIENKQIVHTERVVTGRYETQTPVFSDQMRTIVFQPPWNVPESIKVNELLPKLREGANPIESQGLKIQRNGRDVDAWDIDWNKQDIRNYHIFQPPGDANVLGIVKFLFPNKHAVYLHDTPSKRLFNEPVRMFSHGCMRVRNPVRLAEVILDIDKGWDKSKIKELITTGPEDNDIALDTPLPVHVTYFTAWVDDDGTVKTFKDVYGHEQRIKLGLEGRWGEIVKNRDHLAPSEIPPVARGRDDWGDSDGPRVQPRRTRYTYSAPPPPPPPARSRKKSEPTINDFLSNIFGQ